MTIRKVEECEWQIYKHQCEYEETHGASSSKPGLAKYPDQALVAHSSKDALGLFRIMGDAEKNYKPFWENSGIYFFYFLFN